jgi:hypothetical protein
MFDDLFLMCKDMTKFNLIVGSIEDIISRVSKEYLKDGNLKDAAIDSIIDILEAHKTTQVTK